MNIVWLGDPACDDPAIVGGKAAQLSRLASAGFNVPPGFCLTSEVLEPIGMPALADDSVAVARRSPVLVDEISPAYGKLGDLCGAPIPRVAVRSSSVDEDSDAASFAGAYDTYLSVAGVEAIAAAVERCWKSACSSRAMAYRQQRRLFAPAGHMAVLGALRPRDEGRVCHPGRDRASRRRNAQGQVTRTRAAARQARDA